MSEPQPGLLEEPKAHSAVLVLTNVEGLRQTASRIAALPDLVADVAELDPAAGLTCVVSFGARLWDALSPDRKPHELEPFAGICGTKGYVPATGGDLLLHANCARADLIFELMLRARRHLGRHIPVKEEVHGFRYLDNRDLTGFLDGTANPDEEERVFAALIGDEDPDFAGGSFVFAARFAHDLDAFHALSQREQEQVFGRTRPDSVELEDKRMDAHISRVEIEEDGEELEIFRRSFPYGTTVEAGLLFIAYSRRRSIYDRMMQRMFGIEDPMVTDRLMEFSQARSGGYFFAPSRRDLEGLARL